MTRCDDGVSVPTPLSFRTTNSNNNIVNDLRRIYYFYRLHLSCISEGPLFKARRFLGLGHPRARVIFPSQIGTGPAHIRDALSGRAFSSKFRVFDPGFCTCNYIISIQMNLTSDVLPTEEILPESAEQADDVAFELPPELWQRTGDFLVHQPRSLRELLLSCKEMMATLTPQWSTSICFFLPTQPVSLKGHPRLSVASSMSPIGRKNLHVLNQ